MKSPAHKLLQPHRRKWRRRALWAGLGVLLLLIAAPFLFTGPMLRWYLAHSEYRDLSIRFRTAWLSPAGTLTLYDLQIDDRGDYSGQPLLTAHRADIAFTFSEAANRHLRSVSLQDAELTFHPGGEAQRRLERLLHIDAPSADNSAGITCDQLIAGGHVRFTGNQPWMDLASIQPDETLPLHLILTSSKGGAQSASLVLGDPDTPGRRFLTCVLNIDRAGEKTSYGIDQLQLGNLPAQCAAALASRWPTLPQFLRQAQVDRLYLAGTLSLTDNGLLDGSAKLLDLTAHDASGLNIEHLSAAAHLSGKVSATPLESLTLTNLHGAWDALGFGTWTLHNGLVECQVAGSDLNFVNLEAQWAGTPISTAATLDLKTGLLTRGHASTASFPAGQLRALLPAAYAGQFPPELEGDVVVRGILREFDRDHAAVYVEVAGPEGLTFNLPVQAAASAPGPAAPANDTRAAAPKLAAFPTWPGLVLYNSVLSGTVSWNFRPDALPDVAHGRLTADQLLVLPPQVHDRASGTPFNHLRADFNLVGNLARLDDFYADLPGNGRLALEGNYALDDGSFEDWVLSLNGIDLALLTPWLAPGWSLSGQADTEWHGTLSHRAASLDVSVTLGAQIALQGPDGTLNLSGSALGAALGMAIDRRTGATQVQRAEISGVAGLQADGALMHRLARGAAAPAGSPLARLLDRFAGGAYASFDKIAVTGHIGPADAGASISCVGLDLGAGTQANAGKELALQNLTFKADLSSGLSKSYRTMVANMRITGGEYLAEKLTLGQIPFAEVSGRFSAEKGRVSLKLGSVHVAEGTIQGDATVGFDGTLDSLHLGFTGLHQQQLWRNAFSDVFTAEGPISGTVNLLHGVGGYSGDISFSTDEPGRLKFTPASALWLLHAAHGGAEITPPALARQYADQLADYSYLTARAALTQDATGLHLKIDCPPSPLTPGVPAGTSPAAATSTAENQRFTLHGDAWPVATSLSELLARFAGFPAPAR